MELRHLACFRAVVEAGSISGAARALHVSQPPLSETMKQLEGELGCALFVRGPRSIVLTEQGLWCYQKAVSLLDQVASLRQEVAEVGKVRTLHVGLTSSSVPVFAPLLERTDRSLRFSIHEGNSFQVLELLAHGVVQCALVRTPVNLGACSHAVVARDHMIATGAVSSLADFQGRELVLYRRYRQFLLDAFRRRGISPGPVTECDDARTAVQLSLSSGITAVVPATMASSCGRLPMFHLTDTDFQTEVLAVWLREDDGVQEFLAMLDESFKKQQK